MKGVTETDSAAWPGDQGNSTQNITQHTRPQGHEPGQPTTCRLGSLSSPSLSESGCEVLLTH
jgi:hypothetical protein